MRTTYEVQVRRSGRWWAIDVPELKGIHTQARRLAEVEAIARDAIAAVLEISPRSFDVVIRPMLGDRLESLVADARELRASAYEAQSAAAEQSVRALRSLQKSGIPLRDAGALLGISHQRAAQLADSDTRIPANRRKAIAELRGEYRLR